MGPPLARLLQTSREVLEAFSGELDLGADRIASIVPSVPITPASLACLPLLAPMALRSCPRTAGLTEALIGAAGSLHWRQSYREADGFGRDYLDRYGWCDLAGPDGPCSANAIRVMFGYWGQGLTYPEHAHAPEEHYLVLAGSAWIRHSGQPFQRYGPGMVFHTPPNAMHAAEMRDEPLLALALWRAEDLTVRVEIESTGRCVTVG